MEDFQHHVLDCLSVPGPGSLEPEERVCPMCAQVFPASVTQTQFELHVNQHFEDDNIANDFEVLGNTGRV